MIRFDREVKERELILAMLDMFQDVVLGLNDEDGYPYLVPLNYGYEANEEGLQVYIHFTKKMGLKQKLMRRDPRVCLQFSEFNDFPDRPWKKHLHDYRSVTAKGLVDAIVDGTEDEESYAIYKRGYNLLYLCNGRPLKPLEERKVMPAMYIARIRCPWDKITAKSEFPLRTVEDVPFIDVYAMEDDDTPFDISDIIARRVAEKKAGK